MRYQLLATFALGASVAIAGCTGGAVKPAQSIQSVGGAPAGGGSVTPSPGGKVIAVELETDAEGNNVFRPANVEARKGDVIRFTLVAGVHNAHFLPDSNPDTPALPSEEPLLQLPGQTHDVKVELDPGIYYFHCDPHALLGMIGHLTVVR
jgi:plastocyanin